MIEDQIDEIGREHGRQCRTTNCDNRADTPSGRCARCAEEIEALRGNLGGLTLSGGEKPYFHRIGGWPFVMRAAIWLLIGYTVMYGLFWLRGAVGLR